jgi:hypothetical protein
MSHNPNTAPGGFDPLAAAEQYAQYNPQEHLFNEMIGAPGSSDPVDPNVLPQTARDTASMLRARPTEQHERTYDPRYGHPVGMPSAEVRYSSTGGAITHDTLQSMPSHEHYEASMPQDTLSGMNTKDLIQSWAEAEVNENRTHANDIQDVLQDKLMNAEGVNVSSMIDTMYARKERAKAALKAKRGLADTSEPDEPDAPNPSPEDNMPTEPTPEPEPDTPKTNVEAITPDDEPDQPPADPDERGDEALTETTQELPFIQQHPERQDPLRVRRPDGLDPRVYGHQTWETRRIARANARAAGQDVPAESELILTPLEGAKVLTPDMVELMKVLALLNYPSDGLNRTDVTAAQSKKHELVTKINEDPRTKGLADKLLSMYERGGTMVEAGMLPITSKDAQLLELIFSHNAHPSASGLKKIQKLRNEINATESRVSLNWIQHPDGSITPIDNSGNASRARGDWLVQQHAGTLHTKEYAAGPEAAQLPGKVRRVARFTGGVLGNAGRLAARAIPNKKTTPAADNEPRTYSIIPPRVK